jgi:retinoblastoma-like protein 1
VRGVDLLASLCHNYHTSEDRLKEMMGKSHKAIEEFFSKKAVWASECKTETLDKIDTGMTLNNFSLTCMLVEVFLFGYETFS